MTEIVTQNKIRHCAAYNDDWVDSPMTSRAVANISRTYLLLLRFLSGGSEPKPPCRLRMDRAPRMTAGRL